MFGASYEKVIGMVISSLATGILVPVVMYWLMTSRPGAARVEGKIVWLEYGRALRLFAYGQIALLSAIAVVSIWTTPEDRLAVILLFLLFLVLGGPIVLEVLFVRIGFDDVYIYCHSPWRPSRTVRWRDLTSCSYSTMNQWWIIGTTHQGTIRISDYLSGQDSFLQMLERKTGLAATRRSR